MKGVKRIIIGHGAETIDDRTSGLKIASVTEEDISGVGIRIEEILDFVIVFVGSFDGVTHGLFLETFIASFLICALFLGFGG